MENRKEMWYFSIMNFTRDPKARFNFSANHRKMPVQIKFAGSEVNFFAKDILKIFFCKEILRKIE